jgi:hypothetical protein
MPDIRPIETLYAGHRFRSRLEARWAVFFDHVGIKWEYEPEGYQTSAGWYLPDFRLDRGVPDDRTENDFSTLFAEVKGGPIGEADAAKCAALAVETHSAVLMLGPIPDPRGVGRARQATFHSWWHEGGCYSIELWVHGASEYTFSPYSKGLAGVTDGNIEHVRSRFVDTLITEYPSAHVSALRIQDALTAARSARFEHGETPARP